jgi:hypothetical protein
MRGNMNMDVAPNNIVMLQYTSMHGEDRVTPCSTTFKSVENVG